MEELTFPPIDDFADTVRSHVDRFDFRDMRADNSSLRFLVSAEPFAVIKEQQPILHRLISGLWGTQELQNSFTKWLVDGFAGEVSATKWSNEVGSALMELAVQHSDTFRLEGQGTFKELHKKW